MVQSIPPISIEYENPASLGTPKRGLTHRIDKFVNLATNLTFAPATYSKLEYGSDAEGNKGTGDSTFSSIYRTSNRSLR